MRPPAGPRPARGVMRRPHRQFVGRSPNPPRRYDPCVPPPPTWISYVGPAVGFVALIVSVISLAFSGMTYRRAAPRVKAIYYVDRGVREDDAGDLESYAMLIVGLYNSGLSAVQVDSFSLYRAFLGRASYPLVSFIRSDHEILHGEELPITLGASSSLSWSYEVTQVLRRRKGGGFEPPIVEVGQILRRLRYTTLYVSLGNTQTIRRTRLAVLDDERVEKMDRWFARLEAKMDQVSARMDARIERDRGNTRDHQDSEIVDRDDG